MLLQRMGVELFDAYPTVDQPAMTSHMDLHLARERSPSFDKLCRELERRLSRDRA